jgi:hypothetical protein
MTVVAAWYLAFGALPALVALARGIVTLSDWAVARHGDETRRDLHPLAEWALMTIVGGQILMCGVSTWEMRIQQTEVEMGNRRLVGEWLRDHGWPEETVFLEPLGYIGYFSKMHMLDWPGLVHGGMQSMIAELKPDWVVFRPGEYAGLGALQADFDKHYVPEQVFDARPRLDQYKFIPGKRYVYVDSTFVIFRRRDLRPNDFPQAEASIK